MAIVPIPDCGKGVNKDLLPAELELGVWSEAMNFRFRNGFAEKWGGARQVLPLSAIPRWMQIFANSTARHLVYSNNSAVYAYTPAASTTTTISPYLPAVAATTLTRISGTVAEATIPGNHNLNTGDKITWFGATESGYNVVAATITVMSTTVFRYTVSSIAANATVVGAYVVVTSNQTGMSGLSADRRLSGGALNGIEIINNPSSGLYYWGGDVSIALRALPMTTYVADVGRPFKNFIIQLAPTIGGTKYPYDVIWSNAAVPGSLPTTFTAGVGNEAGRFPLADTDGKLIDCLPLGEVNIIYKEDGYYAQQFIPGNDVFDFKRIPQSDGLMALGCVVDTPVGHVFMTPDLDIKVHQGGPAKSIADGYIRDYIRSLTPTAGNEVRKSCFLCVNERKTEVWVCIPTSPGVYGSQTVCAWNWTNNRWGIFDVSASPLYAAASGIWPYGSEVEELLLIGAYDAVNSYNLLDASNVSTSGTYFGTVTGTLERTGIHLENRSTVKTLQRSRVNVDGDSGETASIYHGGSMTADGTVSYSSAATATTGTTDFVSARGPSGRFLAWKLVTTNYPYRVRSIDMDVTGGGTR